MSNKHFDIKPYTGLFHDGSIFSIEKEGKDLWISMESAEIVPERDFSYLKPVELSDKSSIRGKLYLKDLQIEGLEKLSCLSAIQMLGDEAEILDFNIKDNYVDLFLRWVNYHNAGPSDNYQSLKMNSPYILWENLPKLENLNWK